MTQPFEDKAAVHLEPAARVAAMALIMAATMMVMLDQTIANVALPHMQAALGATPDTISWVLTSYILATAVATPMTGWLGGKFGRVRLFGMAIIGFTISSAVCGLAVSLPMMVGARLVQGFLGAFLIPLSQSFVYDMNAPSKQVSALAIWSMGVMAAPVLGPVIGGYLTETFDWRWVFFINVPIGIVAAVGIFTIMPEFPGKARAFDRIGFILVVLALGGLQLGLDRGTQKDWFDSTEIIIEFGIAISAFWLLLFHLNRHPHPIIPMQLFQDRNFNGAMVLGLVVMPLIVAGGMLLPPLVQVLLGYPVITAGLLTMPRGLSMVISMQIGARLMRRLDGRVLIAGGLVLITLSLWLQTRFSLQMDDGLLIWSALLQGAGLGFSMIVLNYMTVSTLPITLRTDGAAAYSLVRNIGSSLMIALLTALLARNIQINHAEIGSNLHASSVPFMVPEIMRAGNTGGQIAEMANMEVTRQAMMIAYIDDFWLMMWMAIIVIPVIFFVNPIRIPRNETVEIVE